MIKKIVTIKHEIKLTVLNEYLRCCQRIHTIAFLQWRLKYPNPLMFNEEMLTELIDERLKFMYDDYNMKLDMAQLPGKEWALNNKFYKKYGDVVTNAREHNVVSFKQIGLIDPYPDEEKLKYGYTQPI